MQRLDKKKEHAAKCIEKYLPSKFKKCAKPQFQVIHLHHSNPCRPLLVHLSISRKSWLGAGEWASTHLRKTVFDTCSKSLNCAFFVCVLLLFFIVNCTSYSNETKGKKGKGAIGERGDEMRIQRWGTEPMTFSWSFPQNGP